MIGPLVVEIAPRLLALCGVVPDVAGRLLVTAGDNPERMHSEAAFVRLCGVAPKPAAAGRTGRAQRPRELQAYGSARLAATGSVMADVPAIVAEVLNWRT